MGKKIILLCKSILQMLLTSFKRFPVALLLAASTVFTLIYVNHLPWEQAELRDTLRRISMVLALGVPLALSINMFFERSKFKKNVQWGIYLAATASLILYYFFLLGNVEMITVTRYVAFTIALYLTFTIVPYFYKRENYELYVLRLLSRFGIVFLYSVVLYLGLMAILFTLQQLFSINFPNRIYMDIWLVVVGIFAPAFFLGDIPHYRDDLHVNDYTKVFRVLLLYIVMPLVSVYTAILYSYFVMVLVTREWPQGMISNLVLWYSIICTVIIFLIKPLTASNQWGNFFYKILPKAILPLLGMMFVAIGIRINAYGITEKRYFVLIIGLWVVACMIYYAFKRNPRNILVAVSIAMIAVLSVVGPLSSYSVSKFSQNQRLTSILKQNNMLHDGSIRPTTDVPDAVQGEISEILTYFNSNHKLGDIRYLPESFTLSQMEAVFGFDLKYRDPYDYHRQYFGYHLQEGETFFDIQEYDYFTYLHAYSRNQKILTEEGEQIVLDYNPVSKELSIKSGGIIIFELNLQQRTREIQKNNSGKQGPLSRDQMTITDENESARVTIQFRHIGFSGNSNLEDVALDSFEGFVFIKMLR